MDSLPSRGLGFAAMVRGAGGLFARQTTRTNNAAPVAEEASKPESALASEWVSAPTRTIAHWSGNNLCGAFRTAECWRPDEDRYLASGNRTGRRGQLRCRSVKNLQWRNGKRTKLFPHHQYEFPHLKKPRQNQMLKNGYFEVGGAVGLEPTTR
jgi:hypothetical protein